MTEIATAPAVPEPSYAPQAEDFVPTGGRIVVGVDGSPSSKQALRTAARIAESTGARLEAVAVSEMSFTRALGEAAQLGAGVPTSDGGVGTPADEAEAMLRGALREVFGRQRPQGLQTSVPFGIPAQQILEQADGADLIVLGSRGRGAFAGLLLGSVSTKCAAAAKCPVLVVHAPSSDGQTEGFVHAGGRIVVGVDGSPSSKQALRTAARIAELTAANVDAVAVWEMPFVYGYAEAGLAWTPAADTEAMLETTLQDTFGAKRPESLRTQMCFGAPAKGLLEKAEGADLIVVGSRGRGAFAGLLLGSVSTKCAALAHCPVLIVHAPATG